MKAGVDEAYFDPDFDCLALVNNTQISIDNDTCEDCTLVKVDSANWHGILLEMVQLLTDLDLVISKSYISSDGGWLMDVFHVTDCFGKKLRDPTIINYIQQTLSCKKDKGEKEVRTCLGKLVGLGHLASEYATVEITANDRPGLLSEVTAVLAEALCLVVSAHCWRHNHRIAFILHIIDQPSGEHICDLSRLARIKEEIDNVIGVHPNEKGHISVSSPTPGRVHSERRLHQLMRDDGDYEFDPIPIPPDLDQFEIRKRNYARTLSFSTNVNTQVCIDRWKEKGYSVVNIKSKDRPKLLFDTVCTLTDMQYDVFHATIGAHGPVALQEYYIRHKDGCTLVTENERQKVTRCLVAAIERRQPRGLKLEINMRSRPRLLADITRLLRENGLSVTLAEWGMPRPATMVGTFYVINASGDQVDASMIAAVKGELGVESAGGTMKINNKSLEDYFSTKSIGPRPTSSARGNNGLNICLEEQPRTSIGSKLWSHIGRISSTFGSIRS